MSEPAETQIDVNRNSNASGNDDRLSQFFVPGMLIIVTIPYTGD